jgi:hypothetical protein
MPQRWESGEDEALTSSRVRLVTMSESRMSTMPGGRADQHLADDVGDLLEVMARKDVGALDEVECSEASQGVLEVPLVRLLRGREVGRRDVEEREDLEKLLGRERAGAALELTEVALREVQLRGKLPLSPVPLGSQRSDLPGDAPTGFLQSCKDLSAVILPAR